MKRTISILAASATLGTAQAAMAQTEVEFWHAFTGRLGELVAEQVDTFNGAQSDYKVVASHKGNYSETLNAGIAAFRAGEQPDILMVFEVGTATMMAAKGAVKPVYEVMAAAGADFDLGKGRRRTGRAESGRCGLSADHRMAELDSPGELLGLSQHAVRHEGKRLRRH